MLLELRLRNVAVIESVTLPLGPGLNVLTGETGAGKSLVVGALGMLLGERASSDRIRAGAERAEVDGIFALSADAPVRATLDTLGIPLDDDTLILRREITVGRTRAWANGTPVTIGTLAEIGAQLVTVHGQHETHALRTAERQRDVLDRYGAHEALLADVAAAHARVLAARRELQALDERAAHARQRADYLRYVVREVEAAAPRADEEADLDAELHRLGHAEELRTLAAQVAGLLAGGSGAITDRLTAVQRAITQLARIDPALAAWQESVDGAWYALDELARDAEQYAESVDADPRRLREVEQRRGVLTQLQRKYGATLADVLQTAADAKAELALVDDLDSARTEAERALRDATAARAAAARTLSTARTRVADRLGRAVTKQLAALGLGEGRFAVELVPLDEPGATGAESVAFRVALNTGTGWAPLEKVASGGELSRVMLALSSVLARVEGTPVLVFDEIDAGIGGAVAWQVGSVMRELAGRHQLLAISHLAQIAAHASHHVVVQKGAASGVTTADLAVVADDERVTEIARMLGGDADRAVSRAHARELLERVGQGGGGGRDAAGGYAKADAKADAQVDAKNDAEDDVQHDARTRVDTGEPAGANGSASAPRPPRQRRGKAV